ncbi:tetratricopeptide repeat protein [Sulfurimonas sp. SAG-AH-194-C20]|nr:tetratricopeptide repeat protein [Sulfurimonas sp. SAG-AH-194-C20]MDF1878738.1 tetratricopeptide repeat protein [Sulfurimonas sp. SAG-AH-194-C20]
MTLFQILMLGASAFFSYKIYEHIQTLKDPQENPSEPNRTAEAFSIFDSTSLIEKADDEVVGGHLDKALAIYSEANIKDPKNAETLFKMAFTLGLQERNEEALEYYRDSLEVDPENPFSHLEMAYIYLKDNELASARTHLNAALELDPDLEKAKIELEKLNAEV